LFNVFGQNLEKVSSESAIEIIGTVAKRPEK
jgi:hypothetical protein